VIFIDVRFNLTKGGQRRTAAMMRLVHRLTYSRLTIAAAISLPLGILSVFSQFEPAKGDVFRNPRMDLGSCPECVQIRVGLPRIVRGPAPDIADNMFTEIKLPDGIFRGFTAHRTTLAIDGATPSAMGGTGVMVIARGISGGPASCGRWLQHVELADTSVLGWVHNEGPCDEPPKQTHKSMSLATSTDYGMTWADQGLIVTGTDQPTAGKVTGEGDCSAVNGQDGYYYAYCKRAHDRATFVARAPVSDPGPGQWFKYFNGSWSQHGLGGDATDLGRSLGSSVARWIVSGDTVLLGFVAGGLGLYFSHDHVTFTAVPEPLLDLDPGVWKFRPDPSEIVAYTSLLDGTTGSNQLSSHWIMAYTYVQPYEGFDKRYLAFRPIEMAQLQRPTWPQVGVLLARWYDPQQREYWTTTAAVPGNSDTYKLDAELGYLMTSADPNGTSVELEDCVTQKSPHPDHFLTVRLVCDGQGYKRLRTAGWVFGSPHPGTRPLFQCFSETEKSHFAANAPDCDGLGTQEKLLGYLLDR